MGKVPKLKLQVLKVRNIVIILSKLVNGIKLRIEVYKISVIFEKYIRNKLLLYIVYTMQSKSFRQINHRDMCTFQAECTMTFLTIKMRM